MKPAAANLRQTAADLEKAASRLTQEVPAPPTGTDDTPPQGFRRGTVCGRYRNHSRVPDLRLSGEWLGRAGFELGQRFQINVYDGQLTIHAESANEGSGTRGQNRSSVSPLRRWCH